MNTLGPKPFRSKPRICTPPNSDFRSHLASALLAAGLLSLAPTQAHAQTWSLGFWLGPQSTPLSSLNWSGLTHIVQVGVLPTSSGSLTYETDFGSVTSAQFDSTAQSTISTAHSHGVKVLLNLANASGSAWTGATTSANLSTFVNNVMAVVNRDGFDGVDIDWEQSVNWTQMGNLASSLRTALGSKILAADVQVSYSANWGPLAGSFDRISVMTYDLEGTWNPYSWFNCALNGPSNNAAWSIAYAAQKFTSAGIPAAKLNIGLPFYGYISTGGGITGPRQAFNQSSLPTLTAATYASLSANYNLAGATWDSAASVPWLGISNGWITYDNGASLTDKIYYVKSNNLGGWIMWQLGQDYISSQNPSHPLLAAVATAYSTYESELLTVNSSSNQVDLLTESGYSNGQGNILRSTAVGNQVTYLLPNIPSGSYTVVVGLKTGGSRGQFQLSATRADQNAWTNIGSVTDEYSASSSYTSVNLGTWSPASTNNKLFKFTVTGKNASSDQYWISIDYIRLTRQ